MRYLYFLALCLVFVTACENPDYPPSDPIEVQPPTKSKQRTKDDTRRQWLLSGILKTKDGLPVSGVKVTLTATGATTTTDAKGYFQLQSVGEKYEMQTLSATKGKRSVKLYIQNGDKPTDQDVW